MNFKKAFDSLTGNIPEFKKDEEGRSNKKSSKITKYNRKDSTLHCLTNDNYPPIESFSSLSSERLRLNLSLQQLLTPTPIQSYSIPILLDRKNLLASAPTGSGKTAAYLIPIIENLSKTKLCDEKPTIIQPEVFIIAPTQDLVKQIYNVTLKLVNGLNLPVRIGMLTKLHYIGLLHPNKKNAKSSSKTLPLNTRVIVSTPHRLSSLLSHKERAIVKLDKLVYIVIDECDKMVETNIFQKIPDKKVDQTHARHQPFRDQIDSIFQALRDAKKTLNECCLALFSATVSEQVNEWMKSLPQKSDRIEVIQISIGSKDSTVSTVDQWFKYCATEEGKLLEIQNMLIDGLLFPCLIFMESRIRAKDVHQEIIASDRNLSAELVSGEISEAKRDAIITKFCQGEINVLICTDLLCRGIDFKNVKMVINYDAPVTKEDYIHRVGRTGRAGGVRGSAVTFWTDADIPHMSPLISVLRSSVNPARATEYEELQELVDTWVKRRANKMQSKLSSCAKKFYDKGNFIVSARRRERKIAKKIRLAVDQGALPKNISARPWVPNRKRMNDVPGSHAHKLKMAKSE